jgi:signal transduction histidine kinase
MRWLRRLLNPLAALICIQFVWILLVVLWVYWFVGRHKEFRTLAERYSPELLSRGFDWLVLIEGILLLVIVLAGVYVIFLYWRRQSALYEQQRSYISQVTHELKTPLASIQLHLETIRLRKPSQEKLERFLDTMLADTERLNHQINNILMAARLERRLPGTHHPVIDFSALIRNFMEKKREKLPEGGSITLDIEDGVQVAADAEKMETALRNLFENAVLYSPASPEIRVSLRRDGRNCLLTFADRGMGIEKRELRKIFRMFHRVRRPGENIRGTGLGLYIVSSVVREHHGRIRAESEGAGTGCAFVITLPLAGQKESRNV